MTPYHDRDGIRLYRGDCRAVLAELEPESVSCVITSPPFWGLRKYECEPTVWGGDPECAHRLEGGEGVKPAVGNRRQLPHGDGRATDPYAEERVPHPMSVQGGYTGKKKWQQKGVSRQETPEAWAGHQAQGKTSQRKGRSNVEAQRNDKLGEGATCSLCGAWRGWYGLEPTVDCGGATWPASGAGSSSIDSGGGEQARSPFASAAIWRGSSGSASVGKTASGRQAKGIPQLRRGCGRCYVCHTIEILRALRRVLRKDGTVWWDIDDSRGGSWGNYAPTGTGGQRPKATERWERQAYEDTTFRPPTSRMPEKSLCLIPQRIAVAAQEDGWIVRSQVVIPTWMPESAKDRPTDAYRTVLMLCKSKSYWYDWFVGRVPQSSTEDRVGPEENEGYFDQRDGEQGLLSGASYRLTPDGMRNLGSVWSDIGPASYPDKHFAVMPLAEAERCITLSTPPEICRQCGVPRVRVVETKTRFEGGSGKAGRSAAEVNQGGKWAGTQHGENIKLGPVVDAQTTGWTSCACADYAPGVVLDPFAGTGTTLLAAQKLGRQAIGIELSEEYCQQAVTRLTVGDGGLRVMVKARRAGAEQATLLL